MSSNKKCKDCKTTLSCKAYHVNKDSEKGARCMGTWMCRKCNLMMAEFLNCENKCRKKP